MVEVFLSFLFPIFFQQEGANSMQDWDVDSSICLAFGGTASIPGLLLVNYRLVSSVAWLRSLEGVSSGGVNCSWVSGLERTGGSWSVSCQDFSES